jgi:hypothetical protein
MEENGRLKTADGGWFNKGEEVFPFLLNTQFEPKEDKKDSQELSELNSR